ncbi:MAG: PQQ-binding-like beta-propeller repeat protein [Gemmataceae bacterium]
MDGPVFVQRLPNGNTFFATYSRFVEVRRYGSTALAIDVSDHGRISDANRMRDGRIVCLFNNNQLIFFSAEGKEEVTAKMDSWGGVDSLPNGHVIVSQIYANKIVEVDGKGNVVWEFKQAGAWVGARLPDGNTLVASKQGQKMFKVDPKGKILWEKEINGHPHAMHWR